MTFWRQPRTIQCQNFGVLKVCTYLANVPLVTILITFKKRRHMHQVITIHHFYRTSLRQRQIPNTSVRV